MRAPLRPLLMCATIGAACFFTKTVHAHGYAGDRFFPPTVTTDDPIPSDELALPTIFAIKNPAGDEGPSNTEIDYSFEFDKLIFPNFSLGIEDTYVTQMVHHGPRTSGWSNLALTAKYQVWNNAPHEAVISVGLEAEIGRTGNRNVSDNFTTLTPNFYFGKGFGDLPDSLAFFRPFAVTGVLGQSFPTRAEAPNTFNWGFALEYSLPYLQQQVKDIGLPAPFKNCIPVVEFDMSTGENRGEKGLTTGTINPGVLYVSDYFEVAAEAVIPVNNRSGKNVGAVFQVWIFIDDIFPKTFGHPVFGE
jgi:hypothetical protein